jgi:Rieske Fe-S protein
MRCPVASVSDGMINCSCHGSKFSIEDGSVASPPATEPLPESKTVVSGDKVYVDA